MPSLAKMINVSKTTLYKSMSGETESMKIETLEKIAEAINVPLRNFFDPEAYDGVTTSGIEEMKKKINDQMAVIDYLSHKLEELSRKYDIEIQMRDNQIQKQKEIIEKRSK